MLAHMSPTTHHFVFCATANTLVFRMNQCVANTRTVTTATLIISIVANKGAPLFCIPNMDVNILHAESKSGQRKNTQVIFTRKNVNSAPMKSCTCLFFKQAGITDAVAVAVCGSSYRSTILVDGFLIPMIHSSTHK